MKKLSVLCALTLALAGCSSSAESESITVGLTYIPDVQFSPLYVAEEEGYFDDAGLDVTLRHHGAQESLFGALQAGEEDVVFAGGDEMMQARSTGVDVVNWATMYQQYPVVLIADAQSGISTPEDLRGKTVGLPGPYGENYYGLLAMLDSYDLENDVTVEYIGYTQTAAITSGEVDAIIGFSNNDSVAIANAGVEVVEMPLVKGDLPLIGVGLGSMADDLDPETMAKLLEAIERGTETAEADIEKTLDVTQKYVPSLADPDQRELAGKVLVETLELYKGGDVFGAQDEPTWGAMSKFLLEADVLETEVDASEAYTTAVLEARTD